MRPEKHEPTLAERLSAQQAARAAMLDRMKPRPAAQAAVVEPLALRRRVRIEKLRLRQEARKAARLRRRPFGVCEEVERPSIAGPKSYEAPRPEPIRYSRAPPVYAVPMPLDGRPAREVAAPNDAARKEWKNAQWKAGNRRCGYCTRLMTRRINLGATCTVDHRQAVARGGLDVEENWILACNECNNRKGLMSEASFRRLLAAQGVAVSAG
jgi:hypothetical protein